SRRFRRLAGRLADDDADALLSALERQDVAAGEVVITQGSPFDALLLVWDGELNVSIETGDGEREIGHVGPGAFLGEASLLDPGPASATVTADQGCLLLRLDRPAFDGLCAERPALACLLLEELSRVLASRVRAAGDRLEDLLADGVTGNGLVGVAGRLHQDGA
ncbi:MAG TPA: cyclic nucleotide-binding domain-containing protein, partial [Acidimicrobiales bacterium]|nr:cyclic nucleotide-binding domain-containing protein [Acidimicrobiales bacterium]